MQRMSLSSIGRELNYSRERIRQIYKQVGNGLTVKDWKLPKSKWRKPKVNPYALQRLARIKGCSNPECTHKHTARQYDWHHPGEKNFNLGARLGKVSRNKLNAELKLVIPYCNSCHMKLHHPKGLKPNGEIAMSAEEKRQRVNERSRKYYKLRCGKTQLRKLGE